MTCCLGMQSLTHWGTGSGIPLSTTLSFSLPSSLALCHSLPLSLSLTYIRMHEGESTISAVTNAKPRGLYIYIYICISNVSENILVFVIDSIYDMDSGKQNRACEKAYI